jgi:hypothetical protein
VKRRGRGAPVISCPHDQESRTFPLVVPASTLAARAPRPRAVIEDDLRGLPTMRTQYRTGDPRADQLFTELIDNRADRLLDELLRHRDDEPAAPERTPRTGRHRARPDASTHG